MSINSNRILSAIEKDKNEIINLRRWFHEHPESSFKEYGTVDRIKAELTKLGISYNLAGDTGLIGIIKGSQSTSGKIPIIALRADIDALEIEEKNEVEYKSINKGIMHACGHDAHTTSLIEAAKILVGEKDNFAGVIKLIFQPGEETGKGAKIVIDSGKLNDVDAFFGLHVRADLQTGKIALGKGLIMAGANTLNIIVNGKSSHGGRPHEGVDAIVAGCAIVGALQQVVSREIDPIEPAVITIGKFYSGTRENIIANEARITGTVRVTSLDTRKKIAESIKRVVKSTSDAYRTTVQVECEYITPPAINNKNLYDVVFEAAESIVDKENIVKPEMIMATEDFGDYTTLAPGFYAQVGCKNPNLDNVLSTEKQYPQHHEKFNIDEDVLVIISALYVEFALKYFKNHI